MNGFEKTSEDFLRQFAWKAHRHPEDPSERQDKRKETRNQDLFDPNRETVPENRIRQDDGFNGKLTAFLFDVLNQSFEASDEKTRGERVGIRSAATRTNITKRLEEDGLIRVWRSAFSIGRGRPMNLIEPTDKALREHNIRWKKGRGNLPTRVATTLVYEKLSKLQGWTVLKEGVLRAGTETKQIDILCRNQENEVIAIEIAGNPEHEAHNALFCLRFPQVKKHLIIAIKTSVLNGLKKRIQKHPPLKDQRLKTILLSTFLTTEIVL